MKIGYARVSTQDQDLALQIDALTKEGCEKIFQEKSSGAQRDRPELKAALLYMRKGDILIVWKLDRLARSMKQLIETVEDFEVRGIGLKSLQDPIDTSSPSGKLVFHIFSALAEFERGVIRDWTNAGLKSARNGAADSGCYLIEICRPRKPYCGTQRLVAEVAKRVGVSISTLYNHLPAARAESLEEVVS
ncbi:Site-specific DNA recombinase [Nitrosospira briensis]|uniref:Site-specific DNA recombinase n=1 Tax=Nitrosospira briensis TaxID=35799 RepID=A0A1I4Y0P9_9PROT|nr:recombinase family protein [Nitrosospira briensis]SFN31069.1 Site-specific DNA recombinase [Nitrosospira briensis]